MTPEQRRALLEGLVEEQGRLGEGPPDGPWERLAADRLSDEEEAQLRGRAEEDPAVAMALDAFTPLGDSFQADIVARVQRPKPASAPGWSLRRLLRLGLPLVAVGAALWLVTPRPPAPLPVFTAEVAGIDAARRGVEEPAGRQLSRDGALRLTLRPPVRVAGDVQAVAWVTRAGQAPVRVGEASSSTGGAIQLTLLASELGPPGEASVVVLLGRDLRGVDPGSPPEGVQVVREPVVLLP